MKNFFQHARTYIFRGLLAVIPLLLCAAAIQLLYVLIDKRIMGFLNRFFEVRKIPGLGILLLLVALYLIGLIVSNIMGRQILKFVEKISQKIPIIKWIYGVGKQLSQGLSTSQDKQLFKKAVLVRIDPKSELWIPAFVMSTSTSDKGEDLSFVYVPTVPTPTGGFVFVAKSSQIMDPGWTVEECLKIIVSMGFISPDQVKLHS